MDRQVTPPRERPGRGDRFLTNLAYLVPGYQGYKRPDTRQDEDARLRARVLGYLSDLEDLLQERSDQLEQLSLSRAAGKVEERSIRVLRLQKSVRFSPVGFTKFFKQEQLSEACLEKILETDLCLFQEFDEALELLRGTPFPPSSERRFTLFFDSLDAALGRLEKSLVARDRCLSECQ